MLCVNCTPYIGEHYMKYARKMDDYQILYRHSGSISNSGRCGLLNLPIVQTTPRKPQCCVFSMHSTGDFTVLTLLDLSAAFDTVDHATLLHRLNITHGVTLTARVCFTSYLPERNCLSIPEDPA